MNRAGFLRTMLGAIVARKLPVAEASKVTGVAVKGAFTHLLEPQLKGYIQASYGLGFKVTREFLEDDSCYGVGIAETMEEIRKEIDDEIMKFHRSFVTPLENKETGRLHTPEILDSSTTARSSDQVDLRQHGTAF